MIIEYYIKSVFGRELIYIKDLRIKELICGLTQKETIDNHDIKILTELGFKMVGIIPPRNKGEL